MRFKPELLWRVVTIDVGQFASQRKHPSGSGGVDLLAMVLTPRGENFQSASSYPLLHFPSTSIIHSFLYLNVACMAKLYPRSCPVPFVMQIDLTSWSLARVDSYYSLGCVQSRS